MTDPLSYTIDRDLGRSQDGRSQDYTVGAIVEEPIWIGPGSELRLVVPRSGWISSDELALYGYWEACENIEEHSGLLVPTALRQAPRALTEGPEV